MDAVPLGEEMAILARGRVAICQIPLDNPDSPISAPVACRREIAEKVARMQVNPAQDSIWVLLKNGVLKQVRPSGAETASLSIAPSPEWGNLVGLIVAENEITVTYQAKSRTARLDTRNQWQLLPPKDMSIRRGIQCTANKWWGISNGTLVQASSLSDEWKVVPTSLPNVRDIRCSGDDSLMLLTTTGQVAALHPPVPASPVWRWVLIAIGTLAVIALAVLYRRRQKRQSHVEDTMPFRKSAPPGEAASTLKLLLRSDVPLSQFPASDDVKHTATYKLVTSLADFIDNEATTPPVTLAIYGPWGSGKTSVMQLLKSELSEKRRYVNIWFNAWRYHRESQLVGALLHQIVTEIRKNTGTRARLILLFERLLSKPWLLTGVVASALVLAASIFLLKQIIWSSLVAGSDAIANFNDGAMAGSALGSVLGSAVIWQQIVVPLLKVFKFDPSVLLRKQTSQKRLEFIGEFSKEFERVTAKMPQNRRLVIFVDDLDRCPPDRVADVLETINMLTEASYCYFILGLDPEIVRTAVEVKYAPLIAHLKQSGKDTDGFGADFLEKLVTVAVHVPKPNTMEAQLLDPLGIQPDQVKESRRIAMRHALMNRYWPRLKSWVYPVATVLATLVLNSQYQLVEKMKRMALNKDMAGDEQTVTENEKVTTTNTDASPANTQTTPKQSHENRDDTHLSSGSGNTQTPPKEINFQSLDNVIAKKTWPKGGRSASQPTQPDIWVGKLIPDSSPRLPAAEPQKLSRVSLSSVFQPEISHHQREKWVTVALYLLLSIFFGIAFIAILYRKQMPPMVQDTGVFINELDFAKRFIIPNHRRVVRFTNMARLLYHMVRDTSAKADIPEHQRSESVWAPHYFNLLMIHQCCPDVVNWTHACYTKCLDVIFQP